MSPLRLFSLICLLSIHPAIPAETTAPNIVYEEGFVFHLAGKLSKDLSSSLNLEPLGIPREAVRDQMEFFEILYFNELISCDGPLDSLASYLKDFEYIRHSDGINATASRAFGNQRVWIELVLGNWNQMAKHRVINTYLLDSSKTNLPDCVNKNVLEQSEVLRNAKKTPSKNASPSIGSSPAQQ